MGFAPLFEVHFDIVRLEPAISLELGRRRAGHERIGIARRRSREILSRVELRGVPTVDERARVNEDGAANFFDPIGLGMASPVFIETTLGDVQECGHFRPREPAPSRMLFFSGHTVTT